MMSVFEFSRVVWSYLFGSLYFLIVAIHGMEDEFGDRLLSTLNAEFQQRLAICEMAYQESCFIYFDEISNRHKQVLRQSYDTLVELEKREAFDPGIRIVPYSSEISPGTVRSNILQIVQSCAKKSVIIASDKCTNEEFLDDLFPLIGSDGNPIEIRIVTGDDRTTASLLTQEKYVTRMTHHKVLCNSGGRSGKMHNKFIVIDDVCVVTGSPNMTFAAYTFNVESFVAIHHRFIARMYTAYFNYITSGKDKYDSSQPEYERVGHMLELFNGNPDSPIKVCLAPIRDIKMFVCRGLTSSRVIDISMFLIGHASEQNGDILDVLQSLIGRGSSLTLKVDKNQYDGDAAGFMKAALIPVQQLGAKIFKVMKASERVATRTKIIDSKPQFHDKLVLLTYHDGSYGVFIGSAGFTANVQDNLNLENMVFLTLPEIHVAFKNHFDSINATRENLVVEEVQ